MWPVASVILVLFISKPPISLGLELCPQSSTTFVQTTGYKATDKVLKGLDYYDNRTAAECHDLCVSNGECASYFFDAHKNSCFLVNYSSSSMISQNLEKSDFWSFYRKMCPPQGCDPSNVHFELLSGSILVSNSYKTVRNLDPHECLAACRQEATCLSVNIDYKKGVCSFNGQNLRTAGIENSLKSNPYLNYFEKVCLTASNRCNLDWAFERIKGKELVGIPVEKVIVDAATREECESACLDFKPFSCQSAEYNYQMNECRLSPHSRFSSADKKVRLEPSASLVDYMENNCAKGPRGFCSWKLAKHSRMILADRVLATENIIKCQEECLHNPSFICRSFSYDPTFQTCSLSHHSRRSAPNGGLSKNALTIMYEMSTCFDVSIDCEPNVMRAKVASNTLFQGKLYARERPTSCFVDVSNSMEFSLPIGLKGDDCGTSIENEGTFTNILVIQSNDHVMTAFDKAIGVRCSYDVGNITGETMLHINEIAKTDQERSSPSLPDLSLHIVDLKGSDRDVVNLGELLRVQLRMSDEKTYGIFVRNLVARDSNGTGNLTLIDSSGCPVEGKLMREVRTLGKKSKSLETFFEAFSFTGSNSLQLEAEVETCLDRCRPVQCRLASGRSEDGGYEFVTSYGRRRRSMADSNFGENVKSRLVRKSVTVSAPKFTAASEKLERKPVIRQSPPRVKKGHNSRSGKSSSKRIFAYQVDNRTGFFCFEPLALTTLSGATLLIQAVFLTSTLILGSRISQKRDFKKSNLFNSY